MQQNDIFRAKNENIKELEANRAPAKQNKIDPSAGVKQASSDKLKSNILLKSNLILKPNLINQNAIENDENQAERIDAKANNKKSTPVVAANTTKTLANETKAQQKPSSVLNTVDVAKANNNNNVANATAPKSSVKDSTNQGNYRITIWLLKD